MKASLLLVAVLSGCGGLLGGVAAQQSPCMTQPDSVKAYLTMIQDFYSYADSAALVGSGFPWATAANVKLVTTASTCRAAVTNFNRVTGTTGTPRAESSAFVFAIGSTGWAYVRQGDVSEGDRFYYIFAKDWTFKTTIQE